MPIYRVRVPWSGSPVVGPSVSTFYLENMASGTGLDAIKTFFTAIKGIVPTGVSWVVPSVGDILNVGDGTLAGSWSYPASGGVVTASGAANFANGVGARIQWKTNGVHHERRVVGSTFIVPLDTLALEGVGNLTAAVITTIQTAANALVASAGGELVIWSRPKNEATADGAINDVTGALVPDKISWLRTRRT